MYHIHTHQKIPQLISLFGYFSKVTYAINMSNILTTQIILLCRSVKSCPVKSHIVNHLEEANIQKNVLSSSSCSVIYLSKETSFHSVVS